MIWRRVADWVGRARVRREIDEEIRFHLDMRKAEYRAAGMTAREAMRSAERRFGEVQGVRRAMARIHRIRTDGSGGGIMNGIRQDLRFAFRGFARQPMFAGLAVLTLGLGIGANAAMFSLVDSVILHPMPFAEADRLAWIWRERSGGMMISPGTDAVERWRSAGRLEEIMSLGWFETSLALETGVESVSAGRVTTSLFAFLGVRPVIGRGFVAEDSTAAAPPVALLGETFWRTRFGGDPGIVGTAIELDGETHEVVGIAPAALDALYRRNPLKVWIPLRAGGEDVGVNALARLQPGATLEGAEAELRAIDTARREAGPEIEWAPHLVRPYEMTSRELRTGLWVLFGAVGLVLLIACANVANMLLARGVGRRHEMAIRTALGAGRFRLARQLLTESLTLSGVGAATGIVLAYAGLDLIRSVVPIGLADLRYAAVSPTVLLLGACVGVGSGLLFGIAPAGQAVGDRIADALRQGTRGGESRSRSRFRQWLVGFEVALAFVLFVSAALLVRSFVELSGVDPGFDAERLVSVRVNLPEGAYRSPEARGPFYRQVLERVRQLPSVSEATLAMGVPPQMGAVLGAVQVEGRAEAVDSRAGVVSANRVQPEYFATVGIPLRAGRGFTPTDPGSVVIVNERFAEEFWPGESALGKRFRWEHDEEWMTVVGVAGNVQAHGLADDPDRGQVYEPYDREAYPRSAMILARATGDPDDLIALVRGQIASVDPGVPIREATTVVALLADSIARPRFNTMVLTGFAALALLLAVTGLYGVIALAVNQRVREIGIRLALGARAADVQRLMVAWGMVPVMIGLAVGVGASLAVGRVLTSLLFGIAATDFLTYGVAIGLMSAVAAFAAYVPARRAAKVDPLDVLRAE